MSAISNIRSALDSIFKYLYSRPAKGIWYKIKDPQSKTVGYLFGTIHSLDSEFSAFDRKWLRSLHKSKTVAVELTIAEYLKNTPPNTDSHRRNKLLLEEALKERNSLPVILDEGLELEALRQKKQVVSLETFAQQSALIGDKKGCLPTLKNEAERVSIAKKIIPLWEQGNLTFIHGVLKSLDKSKLKKIFTDRDLAMASRIDQLLKKRERLFVGIGTLHLPGVATHLEKKGWTLKRVETVKRLPYQLLARTFRSLRSFFPSP